MPRYMGQSAAEKLGKLAGLDPEERDVVAYGLEYLLTGSIGAALTLLTGFFLGMFLETLAVLICWGLLRLFAGGAHCSTFWRCIIFSYAGIMAAVFLARGIYSLMPAVSWVLLSTSWAFMAVWLWAPTNREKPVNDPKRRRQMRRRALFLVLFAGLTLTGLTWNVVGMGHLQAVAVAGAAGLSFSAFMLSPAGFFLTDLWDKICIRLKSCSKLKRKGVNL